jgi:hypothetical protein
MRQIDAGRGGIVSGVMSDVMGISKNLTLGRLKLNSDF